MDGVPYSELVKHGNDATSPKVAMSAHEQEVYGFEIQAAFYAQMLTLMEQHNRNLERIADAIEAQTRSYGGYAVKPNPA
jgi:hypothetical protein